MFRAKYRARFLQLADIFLSSGMVPAYTAAAFIKKFARLALTAPPAGLPLPCASFSCHALLFILLVPSSPSEDNRRCTFRILPMHAHAQHAHQQSTWVVSSLWSNHTDADGHFTGILSIDFTVDCVFWKNKHPALCFERWCSILGTL